MTTNKNYFCISCKSTTREATQIYNSKCDDCAITYYGDPKFYNKSWGCAERTISLKYLIRWEYDIPNNKKITTILKEEWIQTSKTSGQYMDSTIAELDGWKLFDIRTEEQLEKLLILI